MFFLEMLLSAVSLSMDALAASLGIGACLGTAVALFPVVRRYGEARALGFVTSRVMEAAIIVTGVVSLLAVVSMRQAGGVGGADARLAVAQALVAVRDWTFLLGPGLMAGVNALLLGSLMYTSRLVPRAIPLLGLAGAPLHLGAVVASVFGVNDQVSTVSLLAAAPIALWELSLGLWMTLRGFRRDSAPAVPADVPGSAVPAARSNCSALWSIRTTPSSTHKAEMAIRTAVRVDSFWAPMPGPSNSYSMKPQASAEVSISSVRPLKRRFR